MKDELLRLAAICEQAKGPSRRLGAQVEIAMRGFPELAYQQKCSFRPKGSPEPDRLEWAADWFGAGPVASLDAAMTLVPEKAWVRMDQWPRDFCAPVASITPIVSDTGNPTYSATGSTLALAICAAALKARASMEQSHD